MTQKMSKERENEKAQFTNYKIASKCLMSNQAILHREIRGWISQIQVYYTRLDKESNYKNSTNNVHP